MSLVQPLHLPAMTVLPKLRKNSPQLSETAAAAAEYDSYPSSDEYQSSEDEFPPAALSATRAPPKRLTLHGLPPMDKGDRALDSRVRFHGSSSSIRLVQVTREFKMRHLNDMKGAGGRGAAEGSGHVQDRQGEQPPAYGHETTPYKIVFRRPEFWKAPPVSLGYTVMFSLFREAGRCLCSLSPRCVASVFLPRRAHPLTWSAPSSFFPTHPRPAPHL